MSHASSMTAPSLCSATSSERRAAAPNATAASTGACIQSTQKHIATGSRIGTGLMSGAYCGFYQIGISLGTAISHGQQPRSTEGDSGTYGTETSTPAKSKTKTAGPRSRSHRRSHRQLTGRSHRRSHRHEEFAESARSLESCNVLSWQQLSIMFHTHRYRAQRIYSCEPFLTVEVATDDEWIGGITLQWIGLLKIPTVALVSRSAHKAVEVVWRFVRNSPMDGITQMHDLCSHCGWITQNKLVGEGTYLCDECRNSGICFDCSYVTADYRRLCGQCDLQSDAPIHLQNMQKFFDDYGVHDALDYLQSCGDHRIEVMKQKRMPNFMRYLLILWHRFVEDTGEPVHPHADLLADVYLS